MSSIGSIDELSNPGSPGLGGSTQSQSATSAESKTHGLSGVGTLYAISIFLSAFLLFQVEPLMGKFILPWFGGLPAVWTTCLLFFQIVLFGGYAYAHVTFSRLSPRIQAALHIAILMAACLALPIAPSELWKPRGTEEPISRIVLLLGATVGLPFFVLSSTGPLLQAWFSRSWKGRSPYRLYALSNAGSLLALISFPAYFDWALSTPTMARLWSWSFAGFCILCAVCAVSVARQIGVPAPAAAPLADDRTATNAEDRPESRSSRVDRPSSATIAFWFLLAMVPSVLLLATTNQVCLDVASVPFLWVVPLTLYLLSFILCFDSDWWYSRRMMMPAAIAGMAATYVLLRWPKDITSLVLQVVGYFATFFFCAMVCHGELARRRPRVAHLTSFYLVIAAGGAVGGIFVAVVAPLVFTNYYELHVGLFACAVLILIAVGTDPESRYFGLRPRLTWLALFALLALHAFGLVGLSTSQHSRLLAAARNFYGVLRVREYESGNEHEMSRYLANGGTSHGYEQISPPSLEPTSYYVRQSGVGRLLSEPASGKSRRVGLVGLGIGTLAAYANQGDYYRFYEINPLVEPMARKYFFFLEKCRGKMDIVCGDARLSLDRERNQNFDVIVLDAFSGDAIPVHLLTVEAFEIYLRHLAPKGVIAVHISNRHFALRPVVDALADTHHLTTAAIDLRAVQRASLWVLMSRDPQRLKSDRIRKAALRPQSDRILWTDRRASLFEIWLSGLDEWIQQGAPGDQSGPKRRFEDPKR
jgi:spermidine synthase